MCDFEERYVILIVHLKKKQLRNLKKKKNENAEHRKLKPLLKKKKEFI